MQINIREVQPADYRSIGELIKNELGYPQVDAEKLYTRLDKMKSDDKHLTIIAEMEGKVVGFAGVYRGIAYNVEREYM